MKRRKKHTQEKLSQNRIDAIRAYEVAALTPPRERASLTFTSGPRRPAARPGLA